MTSQRALLASIAFSCTAIVVLAASPAEAANVRGGQWHLESLKISAAHAITKGEGVTVAVIDTGVDRHPDLVRNLLPGTSVVPGDAGNGQDDQEGHGTNMAGLIAAHGIRGRDSALGIAPAAKILPIRDEKPGNPGGGLDIAKGIEWASAHGAKVISISSAGGPSIALEDAVKIALKNDIVVVAGSGNRGKTFGFGYPAAIQGVLAVGAVDRSGKAARFSVSGEPQGICTPGEGIVSTDINGRYSIQNGTSPATAITAGAAALVRAKFPELSAPEVIHRLQATATDNGKPGRDDDCGFGILNVVKALTADVPPLAGSTPTATAATTAASATTTPSSAQTPDTTEAGNNTAAIVGGGVIVLLFGGLIALLVNRRRRNPPTG